MNEISFYDTSVWKKAEYDLMSELYKKNNLVWHDGMLYSDILRQLDEHEIMDMTMVREYLDHELKHTEVYELAVSEAEFLNEIIPLVDELKDRFVKRYKDTAYDNRYAALAANKSGVIQMLDATVYLGAYNTSDMSSRTDLVNCSITAGLYDAKVHHVLNMYSSIDGSTSYWYDIQDTMQSVYKEA